MKACPKCGAEYEDFMSFCMKDGTPLGGDDSHPVSGTESPASEHIPAPPADEIQNVQPTGMETEQFSSEDIAAGETYDEADADNYEQETVIRNRVAIPTAPVSEKAAGQHQTASAGGQQVRSGSEKKSNMGVIVAVLLLGGLLFLGAIGAVGLWWYMSSGDEIAATNVNTDVNSTDANENSDDLFDDSSENSNDNTDENTNEDKTPTPTKTPSPSPTKSPSPSPSVSPSPSPSASPTSTATPSNDQTPTPTATAQVTPTPQTPRTIAGGNVNGKARSLPKPAYPASARAVGAKGTVRVRVLIDEQGNVISASAVSGHPLLRTPAARAARNAKFNPTQVGGQNVKVSGIITYVFN